MGFVENHRGPVLLMACLALLMAILLGGCFNSTDPAPVPAGHYETSFAELAPSDNPAGPPHKRLWKDAIHLDGDSVEFLQCLYTVYPNADATGNDTVKGFTLSTGTFSIAGDSIYQAFATYSHKQYFNPGKVLFDTITFDRTKSNLDVVSPIKIRSDELKIGYRGESSVYFVKFKKSDGWSL